MNMSQSQKFLLTKKVYPSRLLYISMPKKLPDVDILRKESANDYVYFREDNPSRVLVNVTTRMVHVLQTGNVVVFDTNSLACLLREK